jgi:hypothetical protein
VRPAEGEAAGKITHHFPAGQGGPLAFGRNPRQRLGNGRPEDKAILVRIVSMLVGLIRSTSPDRVHEDKASYVTRNEKSD